jgi:hypothetical protein
MYELFVHMAYMLMVHFTTYCLQSSSFPLLQISALPLLEILCRHLSVTSLLATVVASLTSSAGWNLYPFQRDFILGNRQKLVGAGSGK